MRWTPHANEQGDKSEKGLTEHMDWEDTRSLGITNWKRTVTK